MSTPSVPDTSGLARSSVSEQVKADMTSSRLAQLEAQYSNEQARCIQLAQSAIENCMWKIAGDDWGVHVGVEVRRARLPLNYCILLATPS